MSNMKKVLERILRGGADANIKFQDLRALLGHLGFAERIRGSHHIFTRSEVAEILNLQPKRGKAKVYQVKQVRSVIIGYNLSGSLGGETRASSELPNDLDPEERKEEDL
jgi:predicted RNA binding protein YcfA (HicA-like mRNA interferase family)